MDGWIDGWMDKVSFSLVSTGPLGGYDGPRGGYFGPPDGQFGPLGGYLGPLGPTLGHFEHTLCHLGVHLGVTWGNVGVTLKPGAHFRPLCSWNATFCYIILSEDLDQRLVCATR